MNSHSYELPHKQTDTHPQAHAHAVEFYERLSIMLYTRTHTHLLVHNNIRPKCQRPQETHHINIQCEILKKKHCKRSLSWHSVGGGVGDYGPHTIILYFQSVNDFRFTVDAPYHIINSYAQIHSMVKPTE